VRGEVSMSRVLEVPGIGLLVSRCSSFGHGWTWCCAVLCAFCGANVCDYFCIVEVIRYRRYPSHRNK
jgi:hypothetical protein